MRDITVFDTLFITKIVKEFIKHRERMRSEFLKIWTEQACLLKYIIINNYSERKGQPSFPSTDSCSASFACQLFFLTSEPGTRLRHQNPDLIPD